MSVWVSLAVIVVLIVLGGLFAAAEIALVSLRDSQINRLAEQGRRGRKVAHLARDPARFLAGVQIGVTFAGFLSAAYGAATLANRLAGLLESRGMRHAWAAPLALVLVTVAISYLSLVFSELAPKRVALQRAEATALTFATALDALVRLLRPAVWLLEVSSDAVVRLLGGDPEATRTRISEEELREIVSGHDTLGSDERRFIDEVFDAGERAVREVMVPRTEVTFLDAGMPVARAAEVVATATYSRFPVVRHGPDDVLGFVHIRDLLGPAGARRGTRVADVTRPILGLPGTRTVLDALSDMRREGAHIALVADEYGGTDGIVTLEDLIEELVGDIRDEYDARADRPRVAGEDIEVAGLLNLDDFAEITGIELPEGPYETAAGFVMAALGRVPEVGDVVPVPAAGVWLRVTRMDGRRVESLRAEHLPDGSGGAGGPGGASGAARSGDGGAGEAGDVTAAAPG